MKKTEPTRYLVHAVERDHLWLQVLEGEDEGIRVSIPIYHMEYDRRMENTLNSLGPGDVVEATLAERDQRRAGWRADELVLL